MIKPSLLLVENPRASLCSRTAFRIWRSMSGPGAFSSSDTVKVFPIPDKMRNIDPRTALTSKRKAILLAYNKLFPIVFLACIVKSICLRLPQAPTCHQLPCLRSIRPDRVPCRLVLQRRLCNLHNQRRPLTSCPSLTQSPKNLKSLRGAVTLEAGRPHQTYHLPPVDISSPITFLPSNLLGPQHHHS